MSAAPRDAADVAPVAPALAAVFIGGMAGTAARLGLAEVSPSMLWGTLAANLVGAFLLGVLFERLAPQRRARGSLWALLGPGFAGALTTFSALQLEAVELLRDGSWKAGLLYLATSILLGVPLAALGRRLGRGWS